MAIRTRITLPTWAALFLALLTTFPALLNWQYHGAVVRRLERIERKEIEQMITTEWISGGKKRTWTSKWKEFDENETMGDFLQRHAAEVAEALRAFPEDE